MENEVSVILSVVEMFRLRCAPLNMTDTTQCINQISVPTLYLSCRACRDISRNMWGKAVCETSRYALSRYRGGRTMLGGTDASAHLWLILVNYHLRTKDKNLPPFPCISPANA